MINYNLASKTYDHTRKHSDEIIERFASRVSFTTAAGGIERAFYDISSRNLG